MSTARTLGIMLVTALTACPLAMAQDEPVTTATPNTPILPAQESQVQSVQQKLDALATQAAQAVAELPAGEQRTLQTVVMAATGKCQWRATADKPWATAKADQVLTQGTQIRTGRKSKLVLRVGLNATLLIDSLARVTIPTVLHQGKVLTTTVQVDRGRADVKVGHVGLTNDFSVLTPSGALAVKGTEFAVSHSALKGTQIVSARTNAMRAIEVSYYGSKATNYLSASSVSTQETPNPANTAAFASAGAMPLTASEAVDRQDAASATAEAVVGADPVQGSTRTQVAAQQESNTEDAVDDLPLPPDYPQNLDGWNDYFQHTVLPEDDGQLAATIYFDLQVTHFVDSAGNEIQARRVPADFENRLYLATSWYDPSRETYLETHGDDTVLNVPWGAALPDATTSYLGAAYADIIAYGDNVPEGYDGGSADLNALLSVMNDFCVVTFDENGNQVAACRQAFAEALNAYLHNATGTTAYAEAIAAYNDYYESGGSGNYTSAGDCPTCPD
ncbi:MAG: FecR family protein [Phycisphaerales bacterium]|nr:FecR family protein [Phycisphaerales bacterium]